MTNSDGINQSINQFNGRLAARGMELLAYLNLKHLCFEICPPIIKKLLTFLPRSSTDGDLCLMASWITWICIETADRTASSSRLNSSKQPHAPHLISPMNMRPIDFTSMPCCTNNIRHDSLSPKEEIASNTSNCKNVSYSHIVIIMIAEAGIFGQPLVRWRR